MKNEPELEICCPLSEQIARVFIYGIMHRATGPVACGGSGPTRFLDALENIFYSPRKISDDLFLSRSQLSKFFTFRISCQISIKARLVTVYIHPDSTTPHNKQYPRSGKFKAMQPYTAPGNMQTYVKHANKCEVFKHGATNAILYCTYRSALKIQTANLCPTDNLAPDRLCLTLLIGHLSAVHFSAKAIFKRMN